MDETASDESEDSTQNRLCQIDTRRSSWPLARMIVGFWPAVPVLVLGTLVVTGLFTDQLAPYERGHSDLANRLTPPSSQHLLGDRLDGT